MAEKTVPAPTPARVAGAPAGAPGGNGSGTVADWRWDQNTTHHAGYLFPIYAATFCLPRAACLRVADGLATLLAHTMRKTRGILAGNLRRLGRGRYGDAEIEGLVDRTLRNFGRCLVDDMYLARARAGHVRRFFSGLEGGDHLDRALAAGRGAILITPHLGHWELGGAVLASEGYPINVVTVVVPDHGARWIKEVVRRRLGIRSLFLRDGPASAQAIVGILSALRANEIVAMVPDRDTAAAPAEVEFCGTRALFPTGPAQVALRTGAALLPAYVVRDGGSRYRAVIEAPVRVPAADPHERERAVLEVTQEIARVFEGMVARYPDQWYNFFPAWAEGNGA